MAAVSIVSATPRFIFNVEDAKSCDPFKDGVEKKFSMKAYDGRREFDIHVQPQSASFIDGLLSILWRTTLKKNGQPEGFARQEGEGSVSLNVPKDFGEKKAINYIFGDQVRNTSPAAVNCYKSEVNESDSDAAKEFSRKHNERTLDTLKSIFNVSQKTLDSIFNTQKQS